VRATYVNTMLRLGDPVRARLAFEPLRSRASANLKLAAMAMLIDAAEATADVPDEAPLRAAIEAEPRSGAARLRLAQWLMAHSRWQPAIEALLDLVRQDRHFGNDAGRRGLLAVFELCDDAALVRDARQLGAHGYTISEVRGGGDRGDREAAWEADRSIEMKVICEAAVAEQLAQHILANYAPHYAVTMFTVDVGVFRPQKF
jgi:nitrogen regulatory protein P-II 2